METVHQYRGLRIKPARQYLDNRAGAGAAEEYHANPAGSIR
jgi:hypothetical protein